MQRPGRIPARSTRRAASACLALSLVLTVLCPPAAAQAPAEDEPRTLTLLVTSGLSGHLMSDTGSVAGLVATLRQRAEAARAAGHAVAVLDAGRTLAPYAESRHDGGATMARVLAAAGCQAFAPAPMDLALGFERLEALAGGGAFPVLRPFASDDPRVESLAPRALLDLGGGLRLAVVSLFDERYVGEIAAAGIDARPAEPAAALGELAGDASVLRLAVVHSRASGSGLIGRATTWGLVEEPRGFDVLLDPDLGHDLALRREGTAGPVFLVGRRLRSDETWTVAEITLELARRDGRWGGESVALAVHGVDPRAVPDAELQAQIELAVNSFHLANSRQLAPPAPADREQLEEFILRAMRETADAEVAILQRGALRPVAAEHFAAAPLRQEAVMRLLSIDQGLAVVSLSGEQLAELARQSARRGASRSALAFLGLTFEARDPGPEAEVTGLSVNARELFADDLYRVVTSAFLARGGDDYPAFTELDFEILQRDDQLPLELRDDVVVERLGQAEEPFVRLSRRGLWRYGVDQLGLYFDGVSTSRDPEYENVSDSRASAVDVASLLAEVELRADQLWRTFRWENRLSARFGLVDTEGGEREELDDDLRLEISGVFSGATVLGGDPYVGIILDSELRRNLGSEGVELPRQFEQSLAAGLDWRRALWPRLRLGLLARHQDDVETADRFGLFGEAVFERPAAGRWPGIDGRLFVESVEDDAARVSRLDLDFTLEFPLGETLSFTPAFNVYVYDDSRLQGAAEYQRFSLGLTYSWQGKHQRR